MIRNMENPISVEQPNIVPTSPAGSTQASPDQKPSTSPTLVPPQSQSRFSRKYIVFLVILSLSIGGALGYFSIQQSGTEKPPVPEETPIINISQAPAIGEPFSQTIELRGSTGRLNVSGTASRTYTDTQSTHVVSANLPNPPENAFYRAWIATGDDMIFLGTLDKTENGTYVLSEVYLFPSGYSFSSVSSVDLSYSLVVSLETEDGIALEAKVLEGAFIP